MKMVWVVRIELMTGVILSVVSVGSDCFTSEPVENSGRSGVGNNSSLLESLLNIELLPGTSSSTPSSFESTIYFIMSSLMLSSTIPSWLDPGKNWGFVEVARYRGSPEDQKLSPVTASTSRFPEVSNKTDLNSPQKSAS